MSIPPCDTVAIQCCRIAGALSGLALLALGAMSEGLSGLLLTMAGVVPIGTAMANVSLLTRTRDRVTAPTAPVSLVNAANVAPARVGSDAALAAYIACSGCAAGAVTGMRTCTIVPPSGGHSMSSDPPCSDTERAAIGNPNPPPRLFVV